MVLLAEIEGARGSQLHIDRARKLFYGTISTFDSGAFRQARNGMRNQLGGLPISGERTIRGDQWRYTAGQRDKEREINK